MFHAIRHHYYIPIDPLGLGDAWVVNPATIPLSEADLRKMYEESGRQVIEQAKRQVAGMKAELEGRAFYTMEADVSPSEFAIKYAKEHDIDLIVVGCAGHHSRARTALMGTVATRITNDAPCQVLVVR